MRDAQNPHDQKVEAAFFTMVFADGVLGVARLSLPLPIGQPTSSHVRALGHDQVVWAPLAAAPDVHRLHDVERIYEVGFVGNRSRAHRRTARARRLEVIGRRFATNDFSASYSAEETGLVYSQSRIVVDSSIAGDVTMRVFEGTACGALVMTDAVQNGLGDLFRVGAELVTYRDDEDLLVVDLVESPSFKQAAPMRRANSIERGAARRDVYVHLHMVDAILDAAQASGSPPPARLRAVWPALVRRLFV